jgi:hypothetical protein
MWSQVGRRYCTGAEIFGGTTDREAREQLWAQVPVGHALALLSGMLRDLDLAEGPTGRIETAWAATALTQEAAGRARAVVEGGARLLPPQLLLIGVKEALRYCPPGPARDDLSDCDVVLQAVLSIADEIDPLRQDEPLWAGLPASLAAETIANQHFNATAYPASLGARTQVTWREGWSAVVRDTNRLRAGGQPAEIFAEVTGCELDAFLGVAIHLWVQAQQHKYLRFPPEFFRRIGVPPAAVQLFLEMTSVSLADLQRRVAEKPAATQRPWEFNDLRRRPIVRYADGSVQVIRLGFVLERAFGQVPEFDVRDRLRAVDGGTDKMVQGGREEAFRACLNDQFEFCVGEVLRRIFPSEGHFKRVYSEDEMRRAWKVKKAAPKVCDWVVDCGDVWLCFDATNRRLAQRLVSGYADPLQMDHELRLFLAGHKASQIASTIRYLTNSLPRLTGRNLRRGTRFIPLIVTPEDGLPWNPAVYRRVQQLVTEQGTLKTTRATDLAIISLHDLGLVERAVEEGRGAGKLLETWRLEQPAVSFQHFLYEQDGVLRRPQWERNKFSQLIDELVEQQTTYLAGITTSL